MPHYGSLCNVRVDAIQIRSRTRTDPWEILNYTFYISVVCAADAAAVAVTRELKGPS
ncbi:hypothetical protein X777_07548 [Ooceraea biroi]|uniref:Uncharacterized protein n=1 Tax=Ooceraea biroi TaxID=2015173 RepID=A0A026X398_OOCBI|nr:hypothetical protein X777_07548 [Ooceraea biroi]